MTASIPLPDPKKLAAITYVTQEMLDDNTWTFEQLMQAAERRAAWQRAGYPGPNPCIVLGEN